MVRFKFLDDWIQAVTNWNLKLQGKAIDIQLNQDKKKKKTKWIWEK